MSAWLVDTLIYTGLLIALVLVARRHVARIFGPQVAYALWTLPLMRFLLPPIVLPASMAPAMPVTEAEPMVVMISDAPASAAATAPAVGVELVDVLLPLWLLGAAIFLGWRARDYVRMKRDLLADARPVGEFRNIELVESPAVSSPVAFGVRRKVVALPLFFMASPDRAARDLAIAHELAHHRGHDLLANIAAQPVLALHWFNPLAWWGWRAMRRDQEAACDARVMAGRLRHERAAYAQVIAGFAAGDHLSLAAPMACPVLGEKSIVHRLRSLTMNEVTPGRKRLGIAAVATTALVALPLSASISYAAEEPAKVPAAPLAPEVPDVPEPDVFAEAFPDAKTIDISEQSDDGGQTVRRVVKIDGKQVDPDKLPDGWEEQLERRIEERVNAETERAQARVERANAQVERAMARVEARQADVERIQANRERKMEQAERTREMAMAEIERISVESRDCDGEEPVIERSLGDGRTATIICNNVIHRIANKSAIEGLQEAMRELRANRDLSASDRREAVQGIEEAIRELKKMEMSFSIRMAAPPAPPAPPAPLAPVAVHTKIGMLRAFAPAGDCEKTRTIA